MPRAGSTLVEQILASHRRSKARWSCPTSRRWRSGSAAAAAGRSGAPIPNASPASTPAALRALGDEYLERTRIQRKTDRPFFIDKMPNNWAACRADPPDPAEREDHRRAAPPARLLLFQLQAALRPRPGLQLRPRRHRPLLSPTMCALMAHFDAVLPGRVHRVDPRGAGRGSRSRGAARCSTISACRSSRPACASTRTSARCAPPAPSRCAGRSTATGVDQWRDYEPWLGPLKEALGPVLTAYPDVPAFTD